MASGAGYEGNDLCSGVLFGITGSKLVLDLGRNIASNNNFYFVYPKRQFNIQMENGSEVKTLYFPMKTTVLQVKLILGETTQTNSSKIELFFGDDELSDNESLSYYDFPDENAAELKMKLKVEN